MANPAADTQSQLGSNLQKIGTGSGFYVNKHGHLITSYHVVKGCREARISGSTKPAKIVASDQSNDLALLLAETNPKDHAALSGNDVSQVGSRVFVFGFPLSGTLSSAGNFTGGSVSSSTGIGDNLNLFQFSAPVQQGNSGGPVLNERGQVIGVVMSKLDVLTIAKETGDIPQNVNFAVKPTLVKALLENSSVTFSTPWWFTPSRSDEKVATIAKSITVQLECWR